MKSLLLYLDARLGEPSSWVAVGGLLAAAHVSVSPGALHALTLWGAVASCVLGVVLKEAGTKPPQQIAADALGALVSAVKAMPTSVTTETK